MKCFQPKKLTFAIFLSLFLLVGCASVSVRQPLTLQGDHGNLSAVLQRPKRQTSYPLVIILHGFNASKEMPLLTELAKQLHKRGVGTLLFDFNGHGESEGSFLDMTIPNELEDARRVYQYARQLPQVSSVSLAGHSQGAIVAAMLAGELGVEKIKTIALMSPAPELKDDTASGKLFGVSFDPKNPPAFITLPNGLKVGRAYLQTTQHLPIYEASAQYTGPVLVLHSQEDQLVPYMYGQKMSSIYSRSRLETLRGFDHNFTQDTAAVVKIVTDFLAEQLHSK